MRNWRAAFNVGELDSRRRDELPAPVTATNAFGGYASRRWTKRHPETAVHPVASLAGRALLGCGKVRSARMDPNHLTCDDFKMPRAFQCVKIIPKSFRLSRAGHLGCNRRGVLLSVRIVLRFRSRIAFHSFSFLVLVLFLSIRRARVQGRVRAGLGSFGCRRRQVRNGAQANPHASHTCLSSRARGRRTWRSSELDCFVAALLKMNSPCLSLRRSPALRDDCGNPREQSISWIATSLRSSQRQSRKWFIALSPNGSALVPSLAMTTTKQCVREKITRTRTSRIWFFGRGCRRVMDAGELLSMCPSARTYM
jgi:hypothetical protein